MSSGKANDARNTVEVMILGQRLLLKVDQDRARVERLASYVRDKADELERQFRGKQPLPPAKLASLLAINIADDYFAVVSELRELKRAVAQRSRQLLAELES
jgi:cell division protein ZapA (FtsZ GTPase activity inhibitor)